MCIFCNEYVQCCSCQGLSCRFQKQDTNSIILLYFGTFVLLLTGLPVFSTAPVVEKPQDQQHRTEDDDLADEILGLIEMR